MSVISGRLFYDSTRVSIDRTGREYVRCSIRETGKPAVSVFAYCTDVVEKVSPDSRIKLFGSFGSGDSRLFFANSWAYDTMTKDGVSSFLQMIPGIGEKKALSILSNTENPNSVLDLISENSKRFIEENVPSNYAEKALVRVEQLLDEREKTDAILELLSLGCQGVNERLAQRIVEACGNAKFFSIIRSNPYEILSFFTDIKFEIVDRIAEKVRKSPISKNDHDRVCAGTVFFVNRVIENDGNCFITLAAGIDTVMNRLEITREEAIIALKETIASKRKDGFRLISMQNPESGEITIHSYTVFVAEAVVAKKIVRLASFPIVNLCGDEQRVECITDGTTDGSVKKSVSPNSIITEISETSGLTDEQTLAVRNVFQHRISVITGGPGTGKSKTIQTIASVAGVLGFKPIILSPTGMAAKRVGGSTVHRYIYGKAAEDNTTTTEEEKVELKKNLVMNVIDGLPEFSKCEEDNSIIIVDECSMIDIRLAHAVFRLISDISVNTRLVLVGDIDQLPSIGPGMFFADVIHSARIPVSRFTRGFRTRGAKLCSTAKSINAGDADNIVPDESELVLREVFGLKQICEEIVSYVSNIFNELREQVDPEEIFECGLLPQVISPYRFMVNELNFAIQAAVNPRNPAKPKEFETNSFECGATTERKVMFRIGDRIVVNKNDYDIGILNGDMGTIVDIKDNGKMSLKIDDTVKTLTTKKIASDGMIRHAYAITVHKAQGGGFRSVVFAIPSVRPPDPTEPSFLNRSIVYTGVTRAEEECRLFGNFRVFLNAVQIPQPSRNTLLLKHIVSLK